MMMNKKAQNIAEYAMIIAAVSIALSAMSVYFKRGIQTVIKAPVDDLGAFGWNTRTEEQALLVQEIGIEYGTELDGEERLISTITSEAIAINSLTASGGGAQKLMTMEQISLEREPELEYESFSRIRYDQVSRPNPPGRSYRLIPAEAEE